MTEEHVPRILIVGGGYVGMYTALRLQRKLRWSNMRITVVDPRSYMTYQPFLPEAAAGSLEPRHVVVPLRRVLRHCQVITGQVSEIRHADRRARIEPSVGRPYDLAYDVLVVALGSVARTLPIPGLAELGIGFKQVEEVRRHGIEVRLETRLESCVDGHVVLDDGTEFDADTLIWTAGVKANPML